MQKVEMKKKSQLTKSKKTHTYKPGKPIKPTTRIMRIEGKMKKIMKRNSKINPMLIDETKKRLN
jgi:hypothetical protein